MRRLNWICRLARFHRVPHRLRVVRRARDGTDRIVITPGTGCILLACSVLTGCEPLLGVGRAGFGPETSSVSAGPPAETRRADLPHGSFEVERVRMRVTVRAQAAYRVAVLEALSEEFGFDLVVYDVPAWAVSVDVKEVDLVQALAAVLEGTPYTLRYGPNEEDQQHALLAVEFGSPPPKRWQPISGTEAAATSSGTSAASAERRRTTRTVPGAGRRVPIPRPGR